MQTRTIFLTLFLSFLSLVLVAQDESTYVSNTKNDTKLDSIFSKKLNSSYFDDSLNRIRVFAWEINTYTNNVKRIGIDTNQRNIQKLYPFYKNDEVGAIYLGNIGSAEINIDFFKVNAPTPFFFQNPYQSYITTPENLHFYNTKIPYSNLRYSTAGSKKSAEEVFGITLAQNVKPELSFGLNYDRWGTKGLYQNQRSKAKTFSGYVAYLGKKYTLYAGYIYNMENVNENGGVLDDKAILDTTIKPNYVNVRLYDANNALKNNTYFVSQTYGVPLSSSSNFYSNGIYNGPELTIGMYNKYSAYYRIYSDNYQDTSNFYKHYYINRKQSFDSTHLNEFDNRLYVQIRPYTQNSIVNMFGGGLGFQHFRYFMFDLPDYLYGNKKSNQSSTYAYGFASGKFRKYFNWNAFGKMVMAGYNSGDISANGSVSFSVYPFNKEVKLVGDVSFKSETPNFYYDNYFSNHYVWNNNFVRTVESRFGVKLDVPALSLEIGANEAIVDSYIYFGNNSMPAQNSGSISVTAAYLQKDFKLGNLHLDGKALLQKSSNEEVLPLPTIAVNASVYYQFNIVKNVLKSQIGLDLLYNTAYYAYAYNPAVGQFHTQSVRKIGDYPWVDAFINFKWKRAAFFIKGRNVAKGLGGNYDYFSALHYPRVPFQIQYGLSWVFYD